MRGAGRHADRHREKRKSHQHDRLDADAQPHRSLVRAP